MSRKSSDTWRPAETPIPFGKLSWLAVADVTFRLPDNYPAERRDGSVVIVLGGNERKARHAVKVDVADLHLLCEEYLRSVVGSDPHGAWEVHRPWESRGPIGLAYRVLGAWPSVGGKFLAWRSWQRVHAKYLSRSGEEE